MGFTLCTALTMTKHMIFSNVPKVSQICGLDCHKSIKLSGTQGLSLSLQKGGVPEENKISNLLLRLSLVSKRAPGSRRINL